MREREIFKPWKLQGIKREKISYNISSTVIITGKHEKKEIKKIIFLFFNVFTMFYY